MVNRRRPCNIRTCAITSMRDIRIHSCSKALGAEHNRGTEVGRKLTGRLGWADYWMSWNLIMKKSFASPWPKTILRFIASRSVILGLLKEPGSPGHSLSLSCYWGIAQRTFDLQSRRKCHYAWGSKQWYFQCINNIVIHVHAFVKTNDYLHWNCLFPIIFSLIFFSALFSFPDK